MLIKKDQSNIVNNDTTCLVREYNFDQKKIGVAVSELDGRYPQKGETVNEISDEVYLVLSGSANVCIEGKSFPIKEGDSLYIESGKWFCVVADKLKIVASTAPAWQAEQQKYRG